MDLKLEQAGYCYRSKYQTVEAVKDVTCTFSPGTFYAIMGKSGSGKTTLLSILAGLMLPTSGQVLVDGISIAELDRPRLRLEHISVIYQDFNLFPLLTVEENAVYPLRLRRQREADALERAREALLSLDLRPEQFRRLPNTLSGGEQQRVAIARALVTGSDVILADEPTGSLDEENSQLILDILRRLAREQGRSIVVVTHDPVAAEYASVVFRMRDGHLLEDPGAQEGRA